MRNAVMAAVLLTMVAPTLVPAFAQGAGGMLNRLMAADTNHDGSISRAEARAGREQMFRLLDSDNDGFITAAEREQRQAAAKGKRRDRDGGDGADANGDGKISREEFLNSPMRGFDRLDADHNNVLEPSEIEAARSFMARRKQVTP